MRLWRLVLAVLLVVAGCIGVFGQVEPAAAANVATLSGESCGFEALEAAIIAAADGDVITFDCPADTVINFESQIVISRTLTIDGGNGGNGPIVFDGGDQTNFFDISSGGDLTLWGLSLQHGNATFGGAIMNDGTLTIFQSSFRNNEAGGDGGAIYNDGPLTILQSTFTSNQANLGGAIRSNDVLTILQSNFTNNQGSSGGAIYAFDMLTIFQSSFVSNSATLLGGAIISDGDGLHVTSTTFSGNTAESGGSAIRMGGTSGNTVSWSTIVQPDGTSAALTTFFTEVTVVGVIVAGCVVADAGVLTVSGHFLVSGDCEGTVSPSDVGLDEVDTMQVNGVTQTYYPLLDSSQVLDAAGGDCREPASTPEPAVTSEDPFVELILAVRELYDYDELDQLGTIRPEGTACDVGAVEMTNNVAPVIEGLTPSESPMYEGDVANIQVSFSDVDSDFYTFQLVCEFNGDATAGVANGSINIAHQQNAPCPDASDQGVLQVWSLVTDRVSVRETFRFFEVLNTAPVFTSNLSAAPQQILVGQVVTLDAEASDVLADPLTYTYDCGGGTLVGENQCRFDSAGDYQVGVQVDDGDGGQISDALTVSVFDAASQ